MKKVISLVLLATMTVSVLAGCGSSSGTTGAKKNVTLTVLTNRTDIVGTDLKKFGDDYKAKTGVTIKWEASADYEGDTKVRLNSKNYGDVLLIPAAVAVSDLSQYFVPLGKTTDAKIQNYNYNDLKATKNSDGSFTTYGLSYGMGTSGVVYNKATLKSAGVDTFPTTLTGLYDAFAKLKAKGVVPVAINFKDKWPLSAYDDLATVESGNGSWYNTIYKETAPFSADKPNGKALEVLYKIVSGGFCEKDLTTTSWESSKTDLGTGKVGMMFLGTWSIPQMQGAATNKDDIAYAPTPTDDTGKFKSVTSADWSLAVSKNSANIQQAKDFLFAFVDSDYGVNNGFLPIQKDRQPTNPVLKSFLATGVTLLYSKPGPVGDEGDKKDKISNKATIDFYGDIYLQNIAIAAKSSRADFDKAVAGLNTKWAKAKTDLNY